MSAPREADASRGPVRPPLATFLAASVFLALIVFGWGMLSLALDEDVITVTGLGPIPGVTATVVSVAVFAGSTFGALRREHPSYGNSAWIAAAAYIAAVAGAGIGALVSGAGLGVAAGLSARFATTWVGAVVAGAAVICAWAGIALVRTRARRPRWPWEDDAE